MSDHRLHSVLLLEEGVISLPRNFKGGLERGGKVDTEVDGTWVRDSL